MDHAVLDQLLADPMTRLCALPRDMMHAYMHRYIGNDRRGITHGRLAGSADAYSDIVELYKMPEHGILYAVDGVEAVHMPDKREAAAHLLQPATRRLAPAVVVDDWPPSVPWFRDCMPFAVQRRSSADSSLHGIWSATACSPKYHVTTLLDATKQSVFVHVWMHDDYSVELTIARPGSKTTTVLPFSADPHGRLQYVHAAFSAHNACCVVVGVQTDRTGYQYTAWFDPAGEQRAKRLDTITALSPHSYTPQIQGILVDADERVLLQTINGLSCLTRELDDLWSICTTNRIGACIDQVVLMADGSLVLAATTPPDSRPRQQSLYRLARSVK
jgi:hypothetical protein